MLSKDHFYHRITRKLVVAFGTIFNDMKLYKYNKAGTVEIERMTIPIAYATKEKFYARIVGDPSLNKEVQIQLPRMSFEMTSITYDPIRKTSMFNTQFIRKATSDTTNVDPYGTKINSVKVAPYNFEFVLNIYVRNTEDGSQIIEQILPYFSPDYTVTIDLVSSSDLKIDVPIVLENISYDVSNDTGEEETLRTLVWTLTFSAKAMLYGPITKNELINKVQANTYNNTWNDTGERKIALTSGTGNYKVGELVFEGRTASAANAAGYVKTWDPVANNLVINDVSGLLLVGANLRGAVSNTSYKIASFDVNDHQLTNLTVTRSAITANVDTAFGFIETLEEYPNIT
jgi:hypothetical protein